MPETPAENPSEQSTTQSSSNPPANNRRMMFIVVALTVLVLLFLLAASAVDNIRQAIHNQPTPTPITNNPTPTPDETANWKTYANNKFGYSFQYPPTLSVSNCPNYDCGEIIYYPKASGKIEIDEDNSLADITLIGGKYCQYENRFKDITNPKRASLQAQCDLPGVSTANDPILPVIDEKTTNTLTGLSQYSFYLQGYQSSKIGPFYALFFSKPTTELNINKDLVTYYGVYWTPNGFKPLTPDKMSVFNQILSTFKFIDASPSATPKVATPTPIQSGNDEGVMCTQEVKECPDGSYVGRTGPNCEFATCPTQ